MDLSKDDLETLLQLRKNVDTRGEAENEIKKRCGKIKYCDPTLPLLSQVLFLIVNKKGLISTTCRNSYIADTLNSIITGDLKDNIYFKYYGRDRPEKFTESASKETIYFVKQTYNNLI